MGTVKDQIIIESLQVFGKHGVYESEKEQGQIFVVDATLDVDIKPASYSDSIDDAVDYGNVCLYIANYFNSITHDLLETVVDELAYQLLTVFEDIEGVTLCVKKPNAPIPLDFAAVGVSTTKKWSSVTLSIGGNIGDSEQYIEDAITEIITDNNIKDVVVSDYIKTKAYGKEDQDDFINAAISLKTILRPRELMKFMQNIEKKLGRERKEAWGPRTIDIDILTFDDLVISEKDLIIPHIDMCNRYFVLKPLMQIAPGLVHPIRRRTVYDLYYALTGEDIKPIGK